MFVYPQMCFKVLFITDAGFQVMPHAPGHLIDFLEKQAAIDLSVVSVTGHGVPALSNLRESGFQAVVMALDLKEGALPTDQVESLASFVKSGGGLIMMHRTAKRLEEHPAVSDLAGVTVEEHSPSPFEFQVRFSHHAGAGGKVIAARSDDFVIKDTLLRLRVEDECADVFATAHINGRNIPVGLSREYGDGRVVYLAGGGCREAMKNRYFRRMIQRSVRYVCGEQFDRTIRAGIIGYGGAFNMGKHHGLAINAQDGMETVAVCDIDPARTAAAKDELGDHIRTYQKIDQIIEDDGIDMLVMILPHDMHAKVCIAASKSGKHVVTEKPFCITVDEADRMIAAADETDTMLSCFHNRRWDGDFRQIIRLVRENMIGEVFHIDAALSNWSMPNNWWRSDKASSGGVLYDWGAHYVDWLLNIANKRIKYITGHLQKRYWYNSTNEDFALAHIVFEDDTSATLEQGSLVAQARNGWRILGTLGAISNHSPGGEVSLVQIHDGQRKEAVLTKWQSNWPGYYQNVANHLLMGEPLIVTAQQARRIIGVVELAEQSWKQGGKPMALPGEEMYEPDYLMPW